MKKINILLVMTMVIGLLNGCACQNVEATVTPSETATDIVTEVDVVTETEEDIEEIINSEYGHLSEARKKSAFFIASNTEFSVENAFIINSTFEQFEVGELIECLVLEKEYGEWDIYYTLRIVDTSEKVYYYILDSRKEGGRLSLLRVYKDSLDGELIYDGDMSAPLNI